MFYSSLKAIKKGLVTGMLFAAFGAFAKPPDVLKETLKRYREAEGIHAQVKKKVVQGLLQKSTDSEGEIYLSGRRLRLALTSEDKTQTLLVMDGEHLWMETRLPENMGGQVQVSRASAKRLKKSSLLVAVLFGQDQLWDNFKLSEKKATDDETRLTLKPREDSELEVKRVKIVIAPKNKSLKKLTYWDNLDNKTRYKFKQTNFKAQFDIDKLFTYKPPKDVPVTQF